MAHFAKLNESNVVIEVNVINNNCLDSKNEEASGIAFLTEWSGGYTAWVKTSYNAAQNGFRYNYAGIGYTYDPDADAFIAPRPKCGHKELFLNDLFKWNCQGCELEFKRLRDEA